jgi:hypothetical protein
MHGAQDIKEEEEEEKEEEKELVLTVFCVNPSIVTVGEESALSQKVNS